MSMTMRPRIALALVSALAILALLLAACGGGDDDGDDGDATDAPTAAATDGGDDDGGDDDGGPGNGGDGAFEEVYPINQTFWHHGFMVELGEAIFAATEPNAFGDQEVTLTIEAAFTNEGDNQTFFDSSVTMITPSDTLNASFGSETPSVPGGGLTSNGSFLFLVDLDFEIDEAYLVIGSGNEQRAQVPLGPGGGELVSLEPSEATLSGGIALSLIDMNFTTGDIRADNLVRHEEAEPEKLLLTLNFDVTSRNPGNWSVFPQEFALTMPSGSSVAVDGSELPGLPGSEAGLDTSGLYLRFEVDDPAEGTYTLTWNAPDRWLGDGESSPVTYEFEI